MGTTFDYLHSRAVADKLIGKFGMKAALRRGMTDRECWIVITDYLPHEEASQLVNPTDRKVIISAGLGAVPGEPPDNEQDKLVTYVQPLANPPVVKEVLAFTSPVAPISPAGIDVAYQVTVRR
jgi:hypothetical protein